MQETPISKPWLAILCVEPLPLCTNLLQPNLPRFDKYLKQLEQRQVFIKRSVKI